MTSPQFLPAAALADLAEGTATRITLDGTAVLLCVSGGQHFAIAERCSHADESLACGVIRHGWIACPAHGGRFDLASGAPVGPPASVPIAVYPTRVVDGTVEIGLISQPE